MTVEMGDYGAVKVISRPHVGRIGYYDDDEFELIEDNMDSPDECSDEDYKRISIVYFGDMLLAPQYCLLSPEILSSVTIHDLIQRKEELYRLCSPLVSKKSSQKLLNSYFSELHFVETTLFNELVEQRYMKETIGHQIFISHSSKDKPFARMLCLELENNGHKPWLDELDIHIGESIPEKVSQGLQDADFVIVILSKNSVSSKWVEREWQTKYWSEIEKGKIQVLPVLLEDCNIPELLKTKKYANFSEDYNYGLSSLLAAINHLSKQ
ncbi:toll/interleukin-1 receptor domain-containing protein [Providencia alcalifaciens]|uniref:toll/interleukin-1 receptor domain-containing protein n=1 Tax=Providencia alcalifaciens TaxID=126385 RepID=UPI0004504AA4|nr:toll/interleukin-1 receptor domain-containing protein [Providencia alcalifaciens]EUD06977.1 TIR domain protein [Providencia alcalifaciens R90-1475]